MINLNNIREVLEEQGITLRELHKMSGVPYLTVLTAITRGTAQERVASKLFTALKMDNVAEISSLSDVGRGFLEAKMYGDLGEYVVRECAYVYQIGIEHPSKGWLVRSTVSKTMSNSRHQALQRAKNFNA